MQTTITKIQVRRHIPLLCFFVKKIFFSSSSLSRRVRMLKRDPLVLKSQTQAIVCTYCVDCAQICCALYCHVYPRGYGELNAQPHTHLREAVPCASVRSLGRFRQRVNRSWLCLQLCYRSLYINTKPQSWGREQPLGLKAWNPCLQ